MALEAIRQKEEELKQFMIYAGRPGLWHDWQKHQAEARKERRVQEELAKRRRAEIAEAIGLGAVGLLIATMVAGLIAPGGVAQRRFQMSDWFEKYLKVNIT